MTTPQPLAELAARYFADVTLKCWARDKDSNDKWDLLHSPLFIRQDVEYYVGHEPPTHLKTYEAYAVAVRRIPIGGEA